MYIALTLLLALDVFLLVRLRAEMKTAEGYKRAMSESDLTVAILEQMKINGYEVHVDYCDGDDKWNIEFFKAGAVGFCGDGPTLTEAVSELQKVAKTMVNFNATLK